MVEPLLSVFVQAVAVNPREHFHNASHLDALLPSANYGVTQQANGIENP